MSRIGKLPVKYSDKVKIDLKQNFLSITGPNGTLSFNFPQDVIIENSAETSSVVVKPANDSTKAKAMWGLSRSLVNNMVVGVSEGFSIKLEVNGVGYRCAVEGNILTLVLGFSHEIKYEIPAGITIKAEKPTLLVISGADKQKVGQVAAVIRKLRKPEPYKGKGIKYENEKIFRKEGKKK